MPVPLQRMLQKARSCFGAQCQAHPSAAEYMHGGNRLRDQTGTRTMDSSEKDQEKFPHARSYQLQARRGSSDRETTGPGSEDGTTPSGPCSARERIWIVWYAVTCAAGGPSALPAPL